MKFIQGSKRQQSYFSSLEEQVSSDNAVRLMDAFVDKLDLLQLGFTSMGHKSEGRNSLYLRYLQLIYCLAYRKKVLLSLK